MKAETMNNGQECNAKATSGHANVKLKEEAHEDIFEAETEREQCLSTYQRARSILSKGLTDKDEETNTIEVLI